MLKFEGIAVGTKIKAFDFEPFEGRTDRYIVGQITGTVFHEGAKFYTVACSDEHPRRVNDEYKFTRIDEVILVPMEMMMDFDNRVIPLDGPCAPKSDLIRKIADEYGLKVVDLSLSE